MSWLSNIGHDIGDFFKNPIDDIALGAGLLTGGLLLPEALGAFGVGAATDIAGSALGGAAAGGAEGALASAPLDIGVAAGGGALGFAGDAVTDAGGAFPAALPSTASSGGAAVPSDIGSWLQTTDFGSTLSGVPAASTTPTDAGLGIFEGNVNTLANPSFATPGTSTAPVGGLSGALSTASGALKSVAPLVGAAGLAANLYSGYEQKQALNALTTQEQQNAATAQLDASTAIAAAQPALTGGEQLQEYLSTGTLPQNVQAQVDQQVAAAKAQVTQGYASRGMSTDPNQNSALAQDLANVDTQAQALKGNLETQMNQAGTAMVNTANSLIQTGVNATNISSQIPIMMQNLNLQLAQATSAAISSFAAALNGGTQLKTGSGQTVTLQQAA